MRMGRVTDLLSRGVAVGVATAAVAGCSFLPLGDSDGYGPWLDSLITPTGIFDAEVLETGSMDVNLRGEDGAVLSIEPFATALVGDVEMVAEFADNPFQQELYENFSTTAATSSPIVIVYDDALNLDPSKRYRFFLGHFGSSTDMDYSVLFAWDLESDSPAKPTKGWRSDLEALRAAGLIDGNNADGVLDISQALNASTPTDHQREIIVKLLGESMVPGTFGPPPTTD